MDMLEILRQATLAISPRYFFLPVAGNHTPALRERVYCYELYHQLRCRMGSSQLMLMGEPDKRGHHALPPINPDFILHIPGEINVNAAAIEVECRVDYAHVRKDIHNLGVLQRFGYEELVLLLFANRTVPWPALERAAQAEQVDLARIVVLLHSEPGVSALRKAPPEATVAQHQV